MIRRKANTKLNPWFWGSLLAILLLSLGLRFWGLARFNTLVFDEIYFVKFGHNYLTQTPFFDSHPPLGKYMIALGIWLKGFNPFGYRWMNALTGALIPLAVAGIAYQLSHRRSYALIAGVLAAADGLFLVESRYGLINVYIVLFGLLGQWCFLLALDTRGRNRWLWLTLSGIGLGGSISVKWSGLGFLLGIVGVYLAWIIGWLVQKLYGSMASPGWNRSRRLPLQKLGQLNPLQVLVLIPAIAVALYRLVWIPHLSQNPGTGFLKLQQQMLNYHQRVGNGPEVHPYCSAWYSWPWMVRPVDYFYQAARTTVEPLPTVGPPLPRPAAQIYYDVHAMGNPILWWLSTLAILFTIGILVWKLWQRAPGKAASAYPNAATSYSLRAEQLWVPLYLVVNYGANLLPWMDVSRCTFIYHYMPAATFSFLALAWWVDQALHSSRTWLRALGLTVIFMILMALVYWLPIYLGLPLKPEAFQARMLFRSWI